MHVWRIKITQLELLMFMSDEVSLYRAASNYASSVLSFVNFLSLLQSSFPGQHPAQQASFENSTLITHLLISLFSCLAEKTKKTIMNDKMIMKMRGGNECFYELESYNEKLPFLIPQFPL